MTANMNSKAEQHPFAKVFFDNVVYVGVSDEHKLGSMIDSLQASNWTVIDGNEKNVTRLEKVAESLTNAQRVVKVRHAVVSSSEGEATWYDYNLREYSGLKSADSLKELFPGLKLKKTESVKTLALGQILAEIPISDENTNNALIIDIPGSATELIETLQKQRILKNWTFLMLTTTQSRLFETGDTVDELSDLLGGLGYHTRNETNGDPDFPVLYFSFDKRTAAEFAKLNKRIEALTREKSEIAARLDEAVTHASHSNKELERVKQKRDEALARATHTNNELERVKQERDDALDSAASTSKTLKQLKSENLSLKQTLEMLNKTLADSQTQLLQKIESVITSQERQTKRLETSLNMHQFWQTGDYQPLEREQQLGPHFKQFLIQKLSQEHYDIVIQFGASDITLFIGQVLNKLKSINQNEVSLTSDKALEFRSRNSSSSNASDDRRQDYQRSSLPAEICVFDHNASKLKELENSAKQRQLGHLISTTHAPLVDYTYRGQDYLHYDSDEALAQLKALLDGRTAKLLVIVSGPITGKDDHNRFPAAPKVLNALSKHEIHFITDNYYERNAKDVAVQWSRLFDERGLSIEKHIIFDDQPGFAWLLNR